MESILEPLIIMEDVEWNLPPQCPEIGEGELHVWLVDLDDLGFNNDPGRLLSFEEQARYSRLISAKKKSDFAGARTALRVILAKYLNPDKPLKSVEALMEAGYR